ncbi:MAG TPA: YigZ family protein [Panacibacter sp.]|nr:YigZ family protein [Panacibacter sp.]
MAEDENYFQTIEQPAITEFKDRGSRFIAYTYPIQNVNDFKTYLQQLKKDHPKAVHHCFAYRLGPGSNVFRVSDDGEPSGTAGKPILGQIDSKGLTNVLVIVVRYFGGTLLGVPGLINAYKTAAAMALQLSPALQKPVTVCWQVTFGYLQMNEIMRWIKAFNCNIRQHEMQLFCKLIIEVPRSRMNELKNLLNDMHDVEIKQIAVL